MRFMLVARRSTKDPRLGRLAKVAATRRPTESQTRRNMSIRRPGSDAMPKRAADCEVCDIARLSRDAQRRCDRLDGITNAEARNERSGSAPQRGVVLARRIVAPRSIKQACVLAVVALSRLEDHGSHATRQVGLAVVSPRRLRGR